MCKLYKTFSKSHKINNTIYNTNTKTSTTYIIIHTIDSG